MQLKILIIILPRRSLDHGKACDRDQTVVPQAASAN